MEAYGFSALGACGFAASRQESLPEDPLGVQPPLIAGRFRLVLVTDYAGC
jgi:hypothetical protein